MAQRVLSSTLGNSANTDSIRQAKGEPGQTPVPTPTLETNKAKSSSFMAEARSGKTLDILHQKPLIGDLEPVLAASKCIKGRDMVNP